MRAVVLERAGGPLTERNRPEPQPALGEARVRIIANGVCGTDVKIRAGTGPATTLPLILGHEPSGVVESVGDSRDSVWIGRRVALFPHGTCGQCPNCLAGLENVCLRPSGSLGINVDGAMTEAVRVRVANLIEIPPTVSLPEAALAGGVVAVPLCALRQAPAVLGSPVIVFGLGSLAFAAIEILRAAGATVWAVGRNPAKLAVAGELGAESTFAATDPDWVRSVREATGGTGVAAVFDFAGAAEEIPTLLGTLRRGGTIVVIGYSRQSLQGNTERLALDQLSLRGSRSYTRADLALGLRLIESQRVHPRIEGVVPLAGANDAIDRVEQGLAIGRWIVDPSRA